MVLLGGLKLRGPVERADCDQVAIRDATNVSDLEGEECLGFARGSDELDLEPVGLVDLHDCAEIATTQPVLGKIAVQHYGIELLESHG
jgi:hypothetical protein